MNALEKCSCWWDDPCFYCIHIKPRRDAERQKLQKAAAAWAEARKHSKEKR